MSKEVAGTLTSILDTPMLRTILSRGSDLTESIETAQQFWGMDLYTRKPGPAYRDGVFVGTDLDLACFLYALVDRKAVIKIPVYENLRVRSHTEGQSLSSRHNRHGQILALVSNKETFIFSVKIKDMNVMTTSEVGDYRNFAVTDFDGSWYDGWQVIEFLPTADENKFVTENKLWTDNKIVFKHFVHPNRWTSFYGQYYFLTKALIARLHAENEFIREVIKDMEKNGVRWPTSGEGARKEYTKTTKAEQGKKIKVSAFEVELDLPEADGSFRGPDLYNTECLVIMQERLDQYRRAITQLQFMTRATELAFFKHGTATLPAWIKNASWEPEYVQLGKRKKWDRLVLFQPAVGQLGVSIRKRTWDKTEEVSQSY
jgi:hypothetical protein